MQNPPDNKQQRIAATANPRPGKQDRREKLALALRRNLQRRKRAASARSAS